MKVGIIAALPDFLRHRPRRQSDPEKEYRYELFREECFLTQKKVESATRAKEGR